jgi:hypothetical protein
MRQFVDLVSNSLYKPLFSRQIGGDLLDETYKQLQGADYKPFRQVDLSPICIR